MTLFSEFSLISSSSVVYECAFIYFSIVRHPVEHISILCLGGILYHFCYQIYSIRNYMFLKNLSWYPHCLCILFICPKKTLPCQTQKMSKKHFKKQNMFPLLKTSAFRYLQELDHLSMTIILAIY